MARKNAFDLKHQLISQTRPVNKHLLDPDPSSRQPYFSRDFFRHLVLLYAFQDDDIRLDENAKGLIKIHHESA